MVPLVRRGPLPESAAAEQFSLQVNRISNLDHAFQAWAADALIASGNSARKSYGKEWVQRIRVSVAERAEHGDLACRGVLAKYLDDANRTDLLSAFPDALAPQEIRSRFFRSPAYLYLVARGLGKNVPSCAKIVEIVCESIQNECRGHDFPALALRVATLLELRGEEGLDSRVAQGLHAAMLTASSKDAVIALRWLLDRYSDALNANDEAAAFRMAGERKISGHDVSAFDLEDLTPEALVMRFEIWTRSSPNYIAIPAGEIEARVSRALGWHRVGAAIAYAGLTFGIFGFVAHWAVIKHALPVTTGVLATASLAVPCALWLILSVLGRATRGEALVVGVIVGALYFGVAIYAAITTNLTLLTIIGNAVTEIVLVTVTTVAAGAQAVERTKLL